MFRCSRTERRFRRPAHPERDVTTPRLAPLPTNFGRRQRPPSPDGSAPFPSGAICARARATRAGGEPAAAALAAAGASGEFAHAPPRPSRSRARAFFVLRTKTPKFHDPFLARRGCRLAPVKRCASRVCLVVCPEICALRARPECPCLGRSSKNSFCLAPKLLLAVCLLVVHVRLLSEKNFELLAPKSAVV